MTSLANGISSSALISASIASCLFLALATSSADGAAFSSWAGKRSSGYSGEETALAHLLHRVQPAEVEEVLRDLYRERANEAASDNGDYEDPFEYASPVKRAPFSSWAGKRAPFSSWAGKRAPFSSWAGKRAPFSSWAGRKRSVAMPEEGPAVSSHEEEANAPRRIKRSSAENFDEENEEEDDEHVRQRRGAAFSAWGGKRNAMAGGRLRRFARNAPGGGGSMSLVPVRVLRPSRAAFSAWGGR